ncbi:MAG: COG1361 S-layer family protein [Nanoarchaeota archaeon]|nr:COG1361 S-layer family protein [Nanoarchaeota archaeon]
MKKIFIWFLIAMLLTTSTFAVRPESGAVIVDSLKYEPHPAESGSYIDIWIKMENYGGSEADDVTFILEPQFPFSLEPGDEAQKSIGSLDPGDEVVLQYKVRISEEAIEGNNELDFKFTSDGKAWVTHTFDILIRTQDTMLNTNEVRVNPEEVAPGDIVEVSLLLENLADSSIKDLRAELQLTQRDVLAASVSYTELPFTPVDSTNVLMEKRLSPGEQKLFTYQLRVDPDTEPKVYRIPIELSYSDEIGNTTYTEEGIIAIVVAKTPDIMVNLDSSEIYTKNAKGEVGIGIYNIGVSKIKFAVFEILESDAYEVLSTPKLYLGNVDSDDYETADFTLFVKEENPEIKFSLEYKDEYNGEHQDELSLTLKTYSKKEAQKYGFIKNSSSGIIFLIIVILGIGAWIYFKRIKGKKEKK